MQVLALFLLTFIAVFTVITDYDHQDHHTQSVIIDRLESEVDMLQDTIVDGDNCNG